MRKLTVIILLLLACTLFAANEINYADLTGLERYARTVRPSDGYIWDTNAAAWAAAPDWNDTSIDLTEDTQVVGLYQVTYPAGITTAGTYLVFVYDGNDTLASNSDTKIGSGEISWSGTTEITLADVVDSSGRVDIGYINGGATDGYNATLKLKMLDVYNDSGVGFDVHGTTDGVRFIATAPGGVGFNARGDAFGGEFYSTGTGTGLYCSGGYVGLGVVGTQYDMHAALTGIIQGSINSISDVNNIADVVLDELLTNHTDANSLGEILQFINDVIEGDSQIVTAGTPWQKLVEIKGTSTELIRKDLKDIDGNDLSSIYTIIGEEVEP